MQLNKEKRKELHIDAISPPRATVSTMPAVAEGVISWLLVLVALAAGAFLRLWQINAIGYNTDEAVYAGQAAAIAGVPGLKDEFPVFRAHPLLFQFILSLIYRYYHFDDLVGRLLAVAFGLAMIFLVYQLGKLLYGPLPGALAALFIAAMPYVVIVSRQVLLDGPMTFFATLTLYMLARFGNTRSARWLYAAGIAMGLTVLSKETSIILVGAIYVFLALAQELRVRLSDLIVASILMALVIAPFPISLMLAGGSGTGRQYLVWQLFRRPNHDALFYVQTVPIAIGLLVIVAAGLGLLILWRQNSWREKLLLSWIIVPVLFFELWPVKGFQYLLPIAPPLAMLAGRLLGSSWSAIRSGRSRSAAGRVSLPPFISWLASLLVVSSLVFASWQRIQPQISSEFLAGTGGVPGGREAGAWIQANVPAYAQFMTIGPSMANIIQFYGERKAYGLGTSPNPLHRNPAYEPIINPDAQIRDSELQYAVWDSFSATRSPFFAEKLMEYIRKYNGIAIHTESITMQNAGGTLVTKPIIIIYEVRQ